MECGNEQGCYPAIHMCRKHTAFGLCVYMYYVYMVGKHVNMQVCVIYMHTCDLCGNYMRITWIVCNTLGHIGLCILDLLDAIAHAILHVYALKTS